MTVTFVEVYLFPLFYKHVLDSHGALVFCMKDVSREFKSTLEREIGLDDIKGSVQDTRNSSTMSPSSDSSYKNSVADPSESSLYHLCFLKLIVCFFSLTSNSP